jgi:AAA+ superfamily predicted ATPase
MQITNTAANSEVELMAELHKLADAGGSLIQIRTREAIRVATTLRKNFLIGADTPYTEWDAVNGFRRFTSENMLEHLTQGSEPKDFLGAIEFPLTQLRDQKSAIHTRSDVIHFFAYLNPHPFLQENPYCSELLQQYAAALPASNVCILLITPDVPLRGVPVGTILVADLKTPNADELESVLRRIVQDATRAPETGDASFPDGDNMTDEDYRRISYLGLGLTLYEFDTFAAISLIDASLAGHRVVTQDCLSTGIAKGKTEVVKQSDILELISSQDMGDVGGMARLKDWIKARARCFSDEAKEFGIEAPKGFAAVGIPGTGKSLIAKATASALGVPAVRLDFGRVFSKFVGDSESRVRQALSMVEGMAPCVLFVDEIDKGLGGAGGGGGDAGTSSRVLGSFLTWLQECKAPVFCIVTANRIDGLPPELLRRGRFDGIFSVGLPEDDERVEVLAIHLRKRGHDIADIKNLRQFLDASKGYVPAEIESAVKDGLIAAFNDGVSLETKHIVQALHDMVPMSTSHKSAIDKMLDWARTNATPVNYPEGSPSAAPRLANIGGKDVVIPSRRRIQRGR